VGWNLWDKFTDTVDSVGNAIGNAYDAASNAVGDAYDYVADGEMLDDIGGVVDDAIDIAENVAHRAHVVMQGVETGVTGLVGDVVGVGGLVVGGAVDIADWGSEQLFDYSLRDDETHGSAWSSYFTNTSDFVGGNLQDGLDGLQTIGSFGLIDGKPEIRDEFDENILRWSNTTTQVATLLIPGVNVAKGAALGSRAGVFIARGGAAMIAGETTLDQIGFNDGGKSWVLAEDGSVLSPENYRDTYNELSSSEQKGLLEPSRYERNHGAILEHEEELAIAQQEQQADATTTPATTNEQQEQQTATTTTPATTNEQQEQQTATTTTPATTNEQQEQQTATTTTPATTNEQQDRRAFASLFEKDADELTNIEVRREFANVSDALESGELSLNFVEDFFFDVMSGLSTFFNAIGMHGFADSLKRQALALTEDDVETQFGDEFNMQDAALAGNTPAPANAP
jgi:hypothetical protein